MHIYAGRYYRWHLNFETRGSRWRGGEGEDRVLEKCCLTPLAGATFLLFKVLKTGLPLPFSFLTLRKWHSESADEAGTVLPVKVLVFPVGRAMHYNQANESIWKERRREDVSYRRRDWHLKNYSHFKHRTVMKSQKALIWLAVTGQEYGKLQTQVCNSTVQQQLWLQWLKCIIAG